MKTIFKEVQLINTDGSVEIIEEEMVEIINENGEKELIFKGLLDKQQKAEKLFLAKLKSIGINSIEEYNEIKFPEEFSLEVRHARLKSSTLDPAPDSEKSEKFKAIEKLENEIDMDIFNNLIQPRSAGYHSCNNTTSILTTMNGNKLYPSERCVWFEGGDRIMMLKANGTFGDDYVTQSSSKLIRLRKLVLHAMDYCLRLRGSRVELSDLNDSYLGWLNYKDSVRGHFNNISPDFKAGNTKQYLAQIAGYWINFEGTGSNTGTFYPANCFVRTNLKTASGASTYCMYGLK